MPFLQEGQVQPLRPCALDRDLVSGVRVTHDAGGRVVPQHALDAPRRGLGAIADDHYTRVLRVADAERVGAKVMRWQFDKRFHVSPFMPMDMRYDWRFSEPGDTLSVHMENLKDGQVQFDATLTLRREPITSTTLARALAAFPLITFKVSALIYWQALRLLLKRTPFFTHPDKIAK